LEVANGCGKRWYVLPAVYWYMESNNAVARAAVLGMYRDGELVGVSVVSSRGLGEKTVPG
jgi:hypothetical protein